MSVTISDIFNAIPKRFDGEAAGDWNANIQFEFSDGDNWYIAVGEGECSVGTGEVDGASATVKTSAPQVLSDEQKVALFDRILAEMTKE